MIKLFLLFIFIFVISCGYPDIDSVPNFNEIKLSPDELIDYCNSNYSNKKNIDECIKDYDINN